MKINLKYISDDVPWTRHACLSVEMADMVSLVESKNEIIKLLQNDEALKMEILCLNEENSRLLQEKECTVDEINQEKQQDCANTCAHETQQTKKETRENTYARKMDIVNENISSAVDVTINPT